MKYVMKQLVVVITCLVSLAYGGTLTDACLPQVGKSHAESVMILPFGKDGKFKMLYDRRQRPQAVYLKNKLYIVYNGSAKSGQEPKEAAGRAMFISFDPATQRFSEPVQLGKPEKDHHFSPILWADRKEHLHVLFGCHKTKGTHLVVDPERDNVLDTKSWKKTSQINDFISYPSVYNVTDGKQVIYFRYEGHRGAWRFLTSDDNGRTWSGPKTCVTDLNMGGDDKRKVTPKKMNEHSSYQTCFPSRDGRFLHVAFAWYDDNKTNIPEKFYNPRYNTNKNLGLKYNLYYVKIDLSTHAVMNFFGETIPTPIDMDSANARCRIWDTQWRGAGVPPDILLDENGAPSFLHVITENDPQTVSYYYVSHSGTKWSQTRITASNHEWNCGCVLRDNQGVLHACLIVGDAYLEGGYNDKHGGGRIEEWISKDKGKTWQKYRDLTPDKTRYPDWRFNNIRPVRRPDRTPVEGMFLFYGWSDSDLPAAQSFLSIDKNYQGDL